MRFFFAALALLVIVVGCQPGTKGVWTSDTSIDLRRDGSIVITRSANGKAEVVTPKNASTAPSMTMNEAGMDMSGSGEWKGDPVDWAQKNSGVYYIAAIGCALAAVAVFWFFKKPVPAALLGACAVAFTFAPVVIKQLERFLGSNAGTAFFCLIGLLLTAAAVWGIAQMVKHRVDRTRSADAEAALIKKGRLAEATAVRRAADPILQNAMKKRKQIDDAATVQPAATVILP